MAAQCLSGIPSKAADAVTITTKTEILVPILFGKKLKGADALNFGKLSYKALLTTRCNAVSKLIMTITVKWLNKMLLPLYIMLIANTKTMWYFQSRIYSSPLVSHNKS